MAVRKTGITDYILKGQLGIKEIITESIMSCVII